MRSQFSPIKKFDEELQIVYGEVYAPDIPDSQGDFMTAVEVRKMAHAFLQSGQLDNIDRQHDNEKTGSGVVESFIARKGDPDFQSEAWVVGVYIPDGVLWSKVKSGEINGFSFEGLVKSTKAVIALELPEHIEGRTMVTQGHDHLYLVKIGDNGEFLGGWTSDDNSGHRHQITRATVTEPPEGEPNGHTHRYSFTDAIANE